MRNNDRTYGFKLSRKVDGAWTDIFDWADYGLTNENVAFKFVFHKAQGHVHFYYDDGESGTWVEPDESPCDLGVSTYGFPNYRLRIDDTTDHTIKSDYLRVTYPRGFRALYDMNLTSLHYGHVDIWEDDPGGDIQVFDESHEFNLNYGFLVQNEFLRLYVAHGVQYGLQLLYWDNSSGTYIQAHARSGAPSLQVSGFTLWYPFFRYFECISREKVVLILSFQDSATDDEDYYVLVRCILERGKGILSLSFWRFIRSKSSAGLSGI